jgi:SAM-dependent MidA family methyltransferase
MGIALHHPEDGYYTRNIRTIGNRGDFTTIPERTPVLGKAIGRWLREEAGRRGWTRFNVIECGPGSGALAAAVRESFGWFGKRKVALHLVETSQPLRRQQARAVRATSHATVEEALAACDGRAHIYHNEFLDAFPCRVFRRRGSDWEELFLRVQDGRLVEEFRMPTKPLPPSATLRADWPEGQRVEVFESARDWLAGCARAWTAGAMLVVDYGGTTQSIYGRRPAGTLRAYRGHERLTGEAVYELPGRQDITADLNFDDLMLWAGELGLGSQCVQTLADFIGPLEAATELAEAGSAFRVLAVGAAPD